MCWWYDILFTDPLPVLPVASSNNQLKLPPPRTDSLRQAFKKRAWHLEEEEKQRKWYLLKIEITPRQIDIIQNTTLAIIVEIPVH